MPAQDLRSVGDGVSDHLNAFITAHRERGQLTGDATEPGLAGYQVWVACPCGVTFRRQVTEGDAHIDLADLARLN
jgi:hypothetical protein